VPGLRVITALKSNDLKDAGERAEAHKILMELCQADLRCLDAHAHLGNFAFDHSPKDAIRHYEVGLRIGELSLRQPVHRCAALGSHRQPPLSALHARL
jgi:hypothetical protein